MNGLSVPGAPGAWRRWAGLVALIFIVQLALIFWLSDPAPLRLRAPRPAPTLRFAGGKAAELLALQDPTLFALPHRRSFSGAAWLTVPPIAFPPFGWLGPTNWLALPPQELGAVFTRFVETNTLGPLHTPPMPLPEPGLPQPELVPLGPERSTVRVEGGLSGRRLLTLLPLKPWPHTDLLADTVLQLLVNARGRVVSVSLLSGSGLKAADDQALTLARGVRFEPLPQSETGSAKSNDPLAHLGWGRLVFEWQTLPISNPPAS